MKEKRKFGYSDQIRQENPNGPITMFGPIKPEHVEPKIRITKSSRESGTSDEKKEMWRSLKLARKVKPKVVSGVHLKWMSTVMSFGDGSHGALGLGLPAGVEPDAYEPTPVPALPSDIVSVHAGHYHSLALTSNGHLWAWGRNNEAQLGRGLISCGERESWHEPKRVEGLEHVNVCAAFASGVVSAAVGDDGSVWVWGKSKRGQLGLGKNITQAVAPTKVEALSGQNVAKVSFGWGHALARTVDGKLFGWGYSADGRIGKMGNHFQTSPLESTFSNNAEELSSSDVEVAEKRVLEGMEEENNMPIIWEPTLVEELHGVHVVDIACGLDHSLVLCRDGALLSCGSNVYGQLGRAKTDLGIFPVDTSLSPVSIAAGLGHSLAICQLAESDGSVGVGTTNVASWGWNLSSQLGREGDGNLPSLIDALDGENPVFVSGGRAHSLALTSKGELWAWGSGKNGRLGFPSSADQVDPLCLDSLEGFQILQAVSGFDHNLVLVAG
ncbi:serine/threonine-protein kinase Nek8 isoform X2 [Abrus precatorius]|uniref:Serine/threonine-protein kinase Nek8 isoform X2 n=1 Tax=Abrus precatorius TaxID=3816 RepID=A0A8B8M1W3_ABRPR|nr:serine/threonine-protein kinase Nek8 isoform X2 [Abrus precatorius]